MQSDLERYRLWVYEDIDAIKHGKLHLVKNKQTGQLAIKKLVKQERLPVYQSLFKLQHRNLPKVFDIILHKEEVYIIHEFIQGSTLQDLLDSGHVFSQSEVKDYMLQLCDALIILHQQTQPIIHRDIKPSNVMVSADGVIKLIDFDAAREHKPELSDDTVHVGTHGYAAPEQYGFGQTDARSDIYAMGILMHKLLSGADGKSSASNRIFERITDRCTQMNPNDRYPSVTELRAALNRVLRRKRYVAMAGIIGGICLVGLVIFFILNMTPKGGYPLEMATPSLPSSMPYEMNTPAKTDMVTATPQASEVTLPPDKAAMPYVIGLTFNEARNAIANAGFIWNGSMGMAFSDTIDEGRVCYQPHNAGDVVSKTTQFELTISLGPEPKEKAYVPSVIGLTHDEAVKAILDAGFVVHYITPQERIKGSDVVTAQYPRSGKISLHSAISIGFGE